MYWHEGNVSSSVTLLCALSCRFYKSSLDWKAIQIGEWLSRFTHRPIQPNEPTLIRQLIRSCLIRVHTLFAKTPKKCHQDTMSLPIHELFDQGILYLLWMTKYQTFNFVKMKENMQVTLHNNILTDKYSLVIRFFYQCSRSMS